MKNTKTKIKHFIKHSLADIYYHSLAHFAPKSGNRVLMYHAFGTRLKHDTYGISIGLSRFKEHLRFLTDNYKIAPLNAATLESGAPSVSITIDDGYKDNLDAVELFEKYNLPYIIYITTGWIGKEGYLSADDLRMIDKSALGHLGAHSVNHPRLPRISPDEQKREIVESKNQLEQILGRAVGDFAYPHSSFDKYAREVVEQNFEIVSTGRIGFNTPRTNKKRINRIEIIASDTPEMLKRKIEGRYDYLGYKSDVLFGMRGWL